MQQEKDTGTAIYWHRTSVKPTYETSVPWRSILDMGGKKRL